MNGYNHTAVVDCVTCGGISIFLKLCEFLLKWTQVPALKPLQSIKLLCLKNTSSSSVICTELERDRLKTVKAKFMHRM